MQGGGAKESGSGAETGGGKGELEEGGGRTLYFGHHSGQQPTGIAAGQCTCLAWPSSGNLLY